ncbi:Uncharacterized protein APZ42_016958 [Daphnia magna]|uniref:Uncharacterized protein n=1 Tax=Daphnia magna TaxID=35525 RepID=A0A165AA17_9CRUS|nr:Uncharacterized protein APZ42_016958 [Daphnia magna]
MSPSLCVCHTIGIIIFQVCPTLQTIPSYSFSCYSISLSLSLSLSPTCLASLLYGIRRIHTQREMWRNTRVFFSSQIKSASSLISFFFFFFFLRKEGRGNTMVEKIRKVPTAHEAYGGTSFVFHRLYVAFSFLYFFFPPPRYHPPRKKVKTISLKYICSPLHPYTRRHTQRD